MTKLIWVGCRFLSLLLLAGLTVIYTAEKPILTDVTVLRQADGTALGDENSDITISYLAIQDAADDRDPDLDEINFYIQAVASGTLRIRGKGSSSNGDEAAGAVLTSSKELVWRPAKDANNTQLAFSIRAKDSTGLFSDNPVDVKVLVAPVNDAPELSSVRLLTDPGGTALGLEDQAAPVLISYARLKDAAVVLDIDTAVINFRVTGVVAGVLKLRPAGSSDVGVDALNQDLTAGQELVWLPSTNTSGDPLAFRIRAVDAPTDGTAAKTSVAECGVLVRIAADNDAPVLTSVGMLQQSVWAEDTDIVISYAKLRGEVQINDVENHPCILQVASTLTGTLRIRGAGMTDTGVDAVGVAFGVTKELVWRPLDDDNGDKQAFTIHALDVPGDGTTAKLSVDARTVTVHVAPVNDAPVLAGVSLLREAGGAAIGVEDTDIVITYARAMAAASITDREGHTCGLRITAVSAGTLLLRAIAGGATVSALDRNLDADHELVWRPALNAYGDLEAFTVRAIDAPSDGTGEKLSVASALVSVRVGPPLPARTARAVLSGKSQGHGTLDSKSRSSLAVTNRA